MPKSKQFIITQEELLAAIEAVKLDQSDKKLQLEPFEYVVKADETDKNNFIVVGLATESHSNQFIAEILANTLNAELKAWRIAYAQLQKQYQELVDETKG